jgi:hypothetical protein
VVFAFVDQKGPRPEDLLWYVAIYASTVIVAAAAFAVLVGSFIGVTYYLAFFFRLFAAEAPVQDAEPGTVDKNWRLPGFSGFPASLTFFNSDRDWISTLR